MARALDAGEAEAGEDRELTKAVSIRADFSRDLEEVTSWLGGAEARVLDRGAEPAALKVE